MLIVFAKYEYWNGQHSTTAAGPSHYAAKLSEQSWGQSVPLVPPGRHQAARLRSP